MTYLLDVNVLIAILDKRHIHHGKAFSWFNKDKSLAWATCPITENGLIRIVSHKSYNNLDISPNLVCNLLEKLKGYGKHYFWEDSISVTDKNRFKQDLITNSNHITDLYLIGLAKSNNGKLATFDRRMNPFAVKNGTKAIEII